MLNRVTSLLLAASLLLFAPPSANTAATNSTAYAPPRQAALSISQTRVEQAGSTVLTLTGQYRAAGGVVNLRSTVTKVNVDLAGTNPPPTPPPSRAENVEPAQEERYDPGADYYHSYSEMSTSDGRPLAQAAYEYEEAANRSVLYITIGGVTLAFDLNTQEPSPISDADQERLNAWAQSEDAALVDQTSVAIIEQGGQQASTELLLNYYAVAMFVDSAEGVPVEDPGGSGAANTGSRPARRGVQALMVKVGGPAAFGKTCKPPLSNSFVGFGAGLSAISMSPASAKLFRRQGGCFGCCGWRCACFGYGWPCNVHDACTLQYGRFARQCMKSFVVAVFYFFRRAQGL
ncbi:MAG TPA: hypothetical protein VK421_01035 [Pyrinomonadaceae bacterium]|nr:hypothetical protein [Pyrinomonadaceae bacterium]